jgi:hypothetical protein
VSAAEPELLELFGMVLADTGSTLPLSPPCFRLQLLTGEVASIPAGATILSDGPVLDEGRCIATQLGGELIHVFPGIASLQLSLSDRSATMIVAPDERQRVTMSLGMHAVEAALRASGQVPIHAAGLTLPDGRIVMIIGQSGAGKTTAALALGGAGFGLCSDDVVICRVVGDDVTAWSLPRALKVHRRTASMLPWTAPLLVGEWSDEDEKALPLARLRDAIRVEDSTPRQLAALCLLDRSDRATSELCPAGQAELLGVAAADHLRTSSIGVIAGHAGHLAALAAVVRRVPTYRLIAGADPADLGAVLTRGLEAAPPGDC